MTMDDNEADAAPMLSPVVATSRIASLDVMRGLAVLGILAVNVVSFGLPVMVYQDASLSSFPVIGANAESGPSTRMRDGPRTAYTRMGMIVAGTATVNELMNARPIGVEPEVSTSE